jgi:hypothetical protein
VLRTLEQFRYRAALGHHQPDVNGVHTGYPDGRQVTPNVVDEGPRPGLRIDADRLGVGDLQRQATRPHEVHRVARDDLQFGASLRGGGQGVDQRGA